MSGGGSQNRGNWKGERGGGYKPKGKRWNADKKGASQASGETSSPTSAAPPRSTPLSSSAAPAKEEPSYSQSQSQSRSTSAFSSAPSTSVASSSRPLSDAPFFALSEGPLPALPSATIAMQTPLLSQTPSAQTLFLGEGHGVTASKGTPSTLYGLPENLSSLFEAMAKVEFGSLEEDERRAQGLPLSVRSYHSLLPLDDESKERSVGLFGFQHSTYKATRASDGEPVALRRVIGVANSLLPTAKAVVDTWKRVDHPAVPVPLETFYSQDDFTEPAYDPTTRPKPSPSLVFVYPLFPTAETLRERHFAYAHNPPGSVPEGLIWSYIIQLATALRAVHSSGLACRSVEPSRIIVTAQNRVRFSAIGVADTLHPDTQSLTEQQYNDVAALGRLVVMLCCCSDAVDLSMPAWVDVLSQQFSSDLKAFALYLLSPRGIKGYPKPSGPFVTIYDVLYVLTPRLVGEVDSLHRHSDLLLSHLKREMDNGRLFRALCKLCYVHDRPEGGDDGSWAEGGDRYIVRLFLDYVFHQSDEEGAPLLDLGFAVQSLNKLDAGAEDRVLLASRDRATMLALSFREIKRYVESSFYQLIEGGYGSGGGQEQGQGQGFSPQFQPLHPHLSPPMMPAMPPGAMQPPGQPFLPAPMGAHMGHQPMWR